MSNNYEPLDFELEEEPILISLPVTKKKKKLIGLDDLLEDYEREQKKIKEKEYRRKKIKRTYESEDDVEDDAEAKLSVCVDQCQKEISQINGDDEMPVWGIQVFGDQKIFPQHEYAGSKSFDLLQSFMNHEVNSLVKLDSEKGEDFLEGLLANGWLLQLVYMNKRVEKSIATWTFNLMLYSSKTWLMEAACDFWCKILLFKDKANAFGLRIDWLPTYLELQRALDIYGFLLDSSPRISSDLDMATVDSDTAGPPQNVRSLIKCIAACCEVRNMHAILSTKEAEEVLVVIFSLFLDRKLLGLSMILSECMASVINFFRDDEWSDSCEKVAKTLASRLPKDSNSLKLVESVTGIDCRSKQLRSAVAFRFLVACLDEKISEPEEVLRLLCSTNVKQKKCDLLKFYICLSLAENWLSFYPVLKDDNLLLELWSGCLRKCCSAITITDFRSYASNVRSKASYLLQGTRAK